MSSFKLNTLYFNKKIYLKNETIAKKSYKTKKSITVWNEKKIKKWKREFFLKKNMGK